VRSRRPPQLLLCELHAHTTWSDGALTVAELVDLYGGEGFDVVCVTDHTLGSADPVGTRSVDRARFAAYLRELEREAVRARAAHDLLLLPGLELTDNRPEPWLAAHALALGLRRFVSVDAGIAEAMAAARAAGAAIVAAHPYGPAQHGGGRRATRRFWHELAELRPLGDRYELINRHTVFGWLAEEQLPVVASGDFHRPEHLAGWKTLLPCAKDEQAVVAFLRSSGRACLAPFEPAAPRALAA
jgi:hypothetical protein